MNLTKAQQRCLSKYGTFDEAKIIELKSAQAQTKTVPISTKSALISLKPAECRGMCEAIGTEYLEGYEERVLEYTLSDESIDRDGDIMIQAGADLSNFMKNPVVLVFHNGYTFPVGNFIKLWVDISGKALKGWILFADDRVDTSGMAERAFRFAKSRIMRAGSIGFHGREVKFPSKEERVILGMRDYGVIFSRWELMEFSLCPVPSNPNALSNAVKSGALRASDLLYVETNEDEEIPMTKEELDAYLKAELAKMLSEVKADPFEKAGRTISKTTMNRLKKMHERATEACAEIKSLIDEHEEEEDKPEESEADKAAKAAAEAEELELKELALVFKA